MVVVQVCGQAADVNILSVLKIHCTLTKLASDFFFFGGLVGNISSCVVFRGNILKFPFLLKLLFVVFFFFQHITFVIPRIYTGNCINWKGRITIPVNSGKIIVATSGVTWQVRIHGLYLL